MQKRLFFILLVGVVLIVPLVNAAVHLSWGDILNATTSNSTITFSIAVTADKVTVEPSRITLDNVTCLNGASFISQELFDTPNATRDSAEFCVVPPPGPGKGGSSSGQSTVYSQAVVLQMVSDQESFTALRKNDKIDFKINNIDHSITIDSITVDSVEFTVASIPQKFSLKSGEKVLVDLDKNGIDDVMIVVKRVSNGYLVDLFVEKLVKSNLDFVFGEEVKVEISEEIPASKFLEQESSEENKLSLKEEQLKREKTFKRLFFPILLILAVILFIIASIYHKKR